MYDIVTLLFGGGKLDFNIVEYQCILFMNPEQLHVLQAGLHGTYEGLVYTC